MFICALFVFPAFVLQPALAGPSMALPEEREEPNKNKDASDDSTIKGSFHQVNRRAVSLRSPIAQSIDTDACHVRTRISIPALELKDVYQNGLGTRLRC